MNSFNPQDFQKTVFSAEQLAQLLASAKRDLQIADESDINEVIFKFSYDALLKAGLYLIAKAGYKVRSKVGHHIKILERMSEILKDEDLLVLGNKMRQDRNVGLYSGGLSLTEKECSEYLSFVKTIFNIIKS
ncbi:MAG: hypothetical protein ABIE84_02570 [bacterium]